MLELHNKIAELAIVVTTAIVFVGVGILAPLIDEGAVVSKGWAVAIAALTSFGIYKFISSALFSAFKKVQKLRKLLLGDAFLEGTWVGHFEVNGEHIFTIETISQAEGETRISGIELNPAGATRSFWHSESAFIDTRRQQLTYVYSCDVIRTNHQQSGIGIFKLSKSSAKNPPDRLDGYAVDMVDGKKDPNTEHKLSDSVMNQEDALKKAKQRFNLTTCEEGDAAPAIKA